MIQIPETVRVAVPVAPQEPEPPNMRAVALILAMRIAGIGRGALAREIAGELEARAARDDCALLAAEYRMAAKLLREEVDALHPCR